MAGQVQIHGSGQVQILNGKKFSMARISSVVTQTDLSPYYWLTQKSKDNTSFRYWKCVIDLQIKVLLYIHSICEDFKLYVKVVHKSLSWYFIYDHYNYCCWLAI